MPVEKYKPKRAPRILEKTVEERNAQLRELIESAKERVERSKHLVRISKELVTELKQLKRQSFQRSQALNSSARR